MKGLSLSKYRKAIVAAAGVFTVLGSVLADGALSYEDGAAIAMSLLAALGVYRVPNKAA